ncbi:FecR domain-containing protein [Olivibacter sp. SDN3]|uniref:FecR family protein n=1 Tax=Olivibacter sp. SDN3 TaxID=2764720 RepID=UPI0016510C37|nr:FecR family protein [Olivibacter sp. SDN3]QNL50463.1 FecR domain-containing protein [Olivibacter sp. SDN3]
MPNDKRYQQLATKWLNGTITAAEKAEFAKWYNEFPDELEVPSNYAANQKEHRDRLLAEIKRRTGREDPKKPRLGIRLWPAAAAAVLLLIGLSWMGIYFYRGSLPMEQLSAYDDTTIQPGKEQATLVLANGKTITLDSAITDEIARESGVSISKNKDGFLAYRISGDEKSALQNATNTIRTPRGGQFQVELPDGTKVWLNAASSITYSVANRSIRKVKLIGEAYFEVFPEKARPFIVETPLQEVEVLGTVFNVNAYPDNDKVQTTLASGKVMVNLLDSEGGKAVKSILNPGQQSTTDVGSGQIKIVEVNTDQVLSWKSGYFYFDDNNLEEVLHQLERWYDIEVVYNEQLLRYEDQFVGRVPRDTPFPTMLNVLKKIGVNFELKGKKLVITG